MYPEVAQIENRPLPILQTRPDAGEELPAFEELYEQYFPRLYAYLSYRVANRQDAEDLVAETFLKVVKGLPGFRPEHEHSLAAWLFRIAHNTLASFQRDTQHWQELTATLPLEMAENLPAPQNLLPEEQVLKQEQIRLVWRMLESLAPRQQEVLKLKFFGELRNQEIAAVLELDERTVAAYLHRGLEELQRRYLPAQALRSSPGALSAATNPNNPILSQRGIMTNRPGHLSNLLPGPKPGATPARPGGVLQPQNWLEGVGGRAGLENSPVSFALIWFNGYLQEAVPQADETFRLRLKAYLLTQLPSR